MKAGPDNQKKSETSMIQNEERTLPTYTYGNPDADKVLIQAVDQHDLEMIKSETAALREMTDKDFYLIAVKIRDWNADLSPWPAPAVFGREDFGNGAADTLNEILKYTCDKDKTYYIGGYSLAGLFSLWAAYQTDVFRGAAAASPSIWFPGFTEYMKNNNTHASSVYLSLGDKEEKTRNPVMATVGDRIQEACEILKKQGVNTTLAWNPGNHFKDADIRTAKAFAWIIES